MQVLAENLYSIALVAINVGDIDHTYIHADVAYIWRFLAVYDAVASAIAELTVQTVGISYR